MIHMKRCIIIICILLSVVFLSLALLPPSFFGVETPVVLMYHLFEEEPFTELEYLFTDPSDFDAQLTALEEAGYRYAFAREYRRTVKEKTVILTVDDGYEDNLTVLLPILEAHGAKATVFVVSGNVGKPNFLSEEQLRLLSASECIEIGSHTQSHAVLNTVDRLRAEEELCASQADLEALTGVPVTSFSYPQGGSSRRITRLTGRYYDVAFTTNPFRPGLFTNRHAVPRIGVDRGVSADALLCRIAEASFR